MNTAAILRRHEDSASSLEAERIIAELQIDLQNTITLSAGLKRENADLKKQLLDDNAFSNANLQRHQNWKEAWKKERETILARERQFETKCKVEEKRIADRRKEIQEKKLALDGSVGGGIHQDVLKDLQTEHASKIDSLNQEANKWREQLYESRKSSEELQARNAELTSQIKREKEISDTLEKEISLLQEDVAYHMEEPTSSNDTNSLSSKVVIRELKSKLQDGELLCLHLQNEIKHLQESRDDAVLAKDEFVASRQTIQSQYINERSNYESKCKTLERKLLATEEQLGCVKKQAADVEESLNRRNKDLSRLQETWRGKEDGYKQDTEKRQAESAKAKSELKKQLAASKVALAEEQTKAKQLKGRCLTTQDHAMKQVDKLAKELDREDHSEKLIIARDQIVKLENTCLNLQNEIKQSAGKHQAEIQRLEHACESTHKDLSLVLFERKESDKIVNTEKLKRDHLRKEFEASERSLLKLEEQKMKLTQKLEDLERSLKTTMTEADVLKEQASKAKELLKKEQHRSQAYKTKALEAHKRSIEAKEVLDQLMPKK